MRIVSLRVNKHYMDPGEESEVNVTHSPGCMMYRLIKIIEMA